MLVHDNFHPVSMIISNETLNHMIMRIFQESCTSENSLLKIWNLETNKSYRYGNVEQSFGNQITWLLMHNNFHRVSKIKYTRIFQESFTSKKSLRLSKYERE